MNKEILLAGVQDFINEHLNADVAEVALSKSPFPNILPSELAGQILAKKKAEKKLPLWFSTKTIYYPSPLSIEQTSSEVTANHKSLIVSGNTLLDLTGGFGIDSYYFSKRYKKVIHCEINAELSEIARHNAEIMHVTNTSFFNLDGLRFATEDNRHWDTIYADPARRSDKGKVFKLEDCTPNIPKYLEMLLEKANFLMLKTSPLLDIDAGLKELKHVKEIHVVSTKNECKELLWLMEPGFNGKLKIIVTTLNDKEKTFSFYKSHLKPNNIFIRQLQTGLFIYEPDAAILKAGAQDCLASKLNLYKLNANTQLFAADRIENDFLGRIFEIINVMNTKELKKDKNLSGNVIVRNYPVKAEELVKKYRIKPATDYFFIFCKTSDQHNVVISAKILQHY